MQFKTMQVGPAKLTVHYARAGRGQPLLYLHGMLGWLSCEPAFAALAEHFDVIAPYAPGWGPAKDDLPKIDAGPLDLTLHHCDVLDACNVARASVVGSGVGAWMAAELAAIYPARVERLVLFNPLGLWREEINSEDPFAVHPGMPSQSLFSLPEMRKQYVLDGRDKVDAHVEELLYLRASAKFLWPLPDTGIEKRLPRIKAPTLIVTCANDRIVPPAYGPVWQAAIAGATLTSIANSAHVPDIEQPEAFAAITRRFLK